MEDLQPTLTNAETATLHDCEQRIERGLKTFVEVGQSLTTISGGRLYRATHETFEAYAKERWNLSRPRAYELMTAADVVSGIPDSLPAPANAGQATALAKVPEAEREEVWRETVERTDGRPTAAAVRETVAETARRATADAVERERARKATEDFNRATAHVPRPALTSDETGPIVRVLDILSELDPGEIDRLARDWPDFYQQRVDEKLTGGLAWLTEFANAWKEHRA